MKKLLYFIAPIILASACGRQGVTERLNEIDSLIDKEQIDSACVILTELDKVSMTAVDQAHYYLLKTRLDYLTNSHRTPGAGVRWVNCRKRSCFIQKEKC